MNICIENEIQDIILKYQDSFSKTQSDMDICTKQIVNSLDSECIKLGEIMIFLFYNLKIEINKDIIYHIIFDLILIKNVIHFYFSLPPFSICTKNIKSKFNEGIHYLSLFSLTSKISINILSNLNLGLKKFKLKNKIENFIFDYISNSLNLIDDKDNNFDLEELLTFKNNETERNKVLNRLFVKKNILFYSFIFQLFYLLTGEIDNDILDKYGDVGECIGDLIINENTDLTILKTKIDSLELKNIDSLYYFLKDKILKL
jgi:hypothetical protein